MAKKACLAAGLMLALSGAAFADTPIGPGVTGSGGTGATAADANVRAGAGGEAPVIRQDGMPAERADVKARGAAGAKGSAQAAQPDAKAAAAVGASGSAGAAGTTGATALPPSEASTGK
jgi:hypothetical protein